MEMTMRRCVAYLFIFLASAFCLQAGEAILVLRPSGPSFEETAKGLIHELGSEFQCREWIMDPAVGEAELMADLKKTHPKALVLMDNHAIQLYAKVQKIWKDSIAFPPSIALMAVRVDQALKGMEQVAGISYEVPAVTAMMSLRSLLVDPVLKVGVIVRPSMQDYFRENAKWCKSENIELVAFEVSENQRDIALAVRTGVRRLRNQEHVDALWIPNDNYFLTPEIIDGGWLPALERFRKPVLVGVENLISVKIRFGIFGTLPDHYGLGVQTAGMILRLKEENWVLSGPPKVEPPLAVYKILNLPQARKVSEIKEAALVEIDKVLR